MNFISSRHGSAVTVGGTSVFVGLGAGVGCCDGVGVGITVSTGIVGMAVGAAVGSAEHAPRMVLAITSKDIIFV